MKTKLLTICFLLLTSQVFAEEYLNNVVNKSSFIITPEILSELFPLCKIPSSFGQKCKSFDTNEKNNFSPIKIKNSESIVVTNATYEVTTDNWYYTFIIENNGIEKTNITFVDESKRGNYHISETYKLKWDANISNWIILGSTINYIYGNEEDKKNEGVYIPFSKPIPIIKSSN